MIGTNVGISAAASIPFVAAHGANFAVGFAGAILRVRVLDLQAGGLSRANGRTAHQPLTIVCWDPDAFRPAFVFRGASFPGEMFGADRSACGSCPAIAVASSRAC